MQRDKTLPGSRPLGLILSVLVLLCWTGCSAQSESQVEPRPASAETYPAADASASDASPSDRALSPASTQPASPPPATTDQPSGASPRFPDPPTAAPPTAAPPTAAPPTAAPPTAAPPTAAPPTAELGSTGEATQAVQPPAAMVYPAPQRSPAAAASSAAQNAATPSGRQPASHNDSAAEPSREEKLVSAEPPQARQAASVAEREAPPPWGKKVEVFFATDRRPTAELIPSRWRTLAPAAIVGMLGCALFLGFSLAQRFRMLWLLSSALAACLTLVVLHASLIRWQQYTRLAENADTQFSTRRDDRAGGYPLHLGSAQVSLPPHHQPGRVEQPQLWRFELVETPEKHVVVHSLQVSDSPQGWFQAISQAAELQGEPEGFVFIHGYNVHFIDALKRTAQLAEDLHVPGPAICYSWPSRGETVAYTADEATVAWSAPHFERLLLDLHRQTKCRKINVVAHSMGNRALLQALERIDLKMSAVTGSSRPPYKLIDRLVMAAPDVDQEEFATRYVRPLSNLAQQATLYISDGDRALQLSAGLHGAQRLGLLHGGIRTFPGIDSIYVAGQNALALGHSYYGDDPAVLDDLRSFLREGTSAAERSWLRSVQHSSDSSYWQIDRTLHAQLPRTSHR